MFMMGQCIFIKRGYVVDLDNLQIYNGYHCVRENGHDGNHEFLKNTKKFHRTKQGAINHRKKIIEARRIMSSTEKVLKKIESAKS